MPSIKQTQKPEASQTQVQQPKQAVGTQTRIDINQIVFASQPRQLRTWLANREMETDADLQADEAPAPEDQEEMDADQDLRDDEENAEETGADGEFGDNSIPIDNYVAPPNGQLQWPARPVLDLENHYLIVIGDSDSGDKFCHFQAPPWLTTHRIRTARWHTSKLGRFLKALALWLQETRQAFLKQPSPQAFVAPETNFDASPVVLQQGLLEHVNAVMARQNDHKETYKLDKAAFSRLLGSIRLCWPLWNMPLAAVFEPEYRRAWVLQGCLNRGAEFLGKPEDYTLPSLVRKELKQNRKTPEANLTTVDYLRKLLDQASISEQHAPSIVKETARQHRQKKPKST